MKVNTNNLILRNNTGNKEKSELIKGFVVRNKTFDFVFSEIKASTSDKPEQHIVFVGPRGAGKTTMLHRLKYAIEDDPQMNKRIIPVMFTEEQYHLLDLFDLWMGIADLLEDKAGFSQLSGQMDQFEGNYREEKACDLLHKTLEKEKQKIIVFIENVDVFLNKIGTAGQKRLREVLTTSHRIRLICSSTTVFNGMIDYSSPFYQFFQTVRLDGLTKDESIRLLYSYAQQDEDRVKLEKIIRETPQRIEALRRLTAGNPRIISYLYSIFLDNQDGKAMIDLYQLMDNITFLYKAELDQLGAKQQKLIDALARHWDAMSTKEIAKKTGIESKNVSALLKELERNRYVEQIPTNNKNFLYRISDRLMNIWYLMRFGKAQEKQNVLWLVRFFELWCDESDLSTRINQHLKEIESENYDKRAALDVGKALMACKHILPQLRVELAKATRNKVGTDQDLGLSSGQVLEAAAAYLSAGELNKMKEAFAEIKDSETREFLIELMRKAQREGEVDGGVLEGFYQKHPQSETAFLVGTIFEQVNSNWDKAINYYDLALSGGFMGVAFRLGEIYYNRDEFEKAEKHLMLNLKNNKIEEGTTYGLLGTIHLIKSQLRSGKAYVKKGIDKNDPWSIVIHIYTLLRQEAESGEIQKWLKKLESVGIRQILTLVEEFILNNRKTEKLFLLELFTNNDEMITKPDFFWELKFAVLNLWNLEINDGLKKFNSILNELYGDEILQRIYSEKLADSIQTFLQMLIALGQFNAANELFENQNLKNQFKPIYYALMFYQQDQFPNEYLRMGPELKETVDQIIARIEDMKVNLF